MTGLRDSYTKTIIIRKWEHAVIKQEQSPCSHEKLSVVISCFRDIIIGMLVIRIYEYS